MLGLALRISKFRAPAKLETLLEKICGKYSSFDECWPDANRYEMN